MMIALLILPLHSIDALVCATSRLLTSANEVCLETVRRETEFLLLYQEK